MVVQYKECRTVRHKRINVPIYNVDVHFFLTRKPHDIIRWVKRHGCYLEESAIQELFNEGTEGSTEKICKVSAPTQYFMWIRSFRNTPEDWNTVAHELCHMKNYIWEHIGLKDQVPTKCDEVEAYLVGFLTEEFFRFIKT